MGFLKNILNEIENNSIELLLDKANPLLRRALDKLIDTCTAKQKFLQLAKTGNNEDFILDTTNLRYNVNEMTFGNNGKDFMESIHDGSILYPKAIYNVNCNSKEDLIKMGFKIAEDTGGMVDFNGNVARPNNMDYSDDFIKSLTWEHIYNGWNRHNINYRAEYYISDKNVYVSKFGLHSVRFPAASSDLTRQELTAQINDFLLQLPIEKRKNYLHPMGYDRWHIWVAKAFIEIEKIPAYWDGRKVAGAETVTIDNEGVSIKDKDDEIVAVEVDHMNGIHTDNSLNNLRIVRKSENGAASQIYGFYIWEIKTTKDLPCDVFVRLEYDSTTHNTKPEYYLDSDYTRPITEDIAQYINMPCDTKKSDSTKSYGEDNRSKCILKANTANSIGLKQIPIMIGFKNGDVKQAQSAEAVANDMHMSVEQVYAFVKMTTKENDPNVLKNLADDNIIFMHYCTNQILKERKSAEEIEAGERQDDEIEQLVNAPTASKLNVNEIVSYLVNNPNYNISGESESFLETKNNNGIISIANRGITFSQYTNSKQNLDGEEWYAGLYVDLTNKKIFSGSSFKFYVSPVCPTGFKGPKNPQEWVHLTAFNKVTGKKDAFYKIQVSNYGRIAFFNESTKKYEIKHSDYFSNSYKREVATMWEYNYDVKLKQFGITKIKGVGYHSEKKDMRIHDLVASTLKFNELLALFSKYSTVRSSDNSLMVHHIDEDIANHSPNNLEWVLGRENTLFSHGLTYLVAFYKQGLKEYPILGFPMENGNVQKSYNSRKSYDVTLPGGQKKSIKLPDITVAMKCLRATSQWAPDELFAENEGIMFRECVAKDLRFTIADPQSIAKQIIFVILSKRGDILRPDDTIQLFNVDGDVSVFNPSTNADEVSGYVMTYGDFLKYREKEKYFKPSLETGGDEMNAKFKQPMFESDMSKMKYLMDKINKRQ